MGNRDLVVGTMDIRAARYGRRLETRGGHVFRLDDAARIVEAWASSMTSRRSTRCLIRADATRYRRQAGTRLGRTPYRPTL
jgi:hypothetical protein